MSIITKYFIKEFLTPFFFSLVLVLFVVFTVQMQKMLNVPFFRGLAFSDFFLLFACTLPPFLMLALPISACIATVVSFSRLVADNEITALASGGISPQKLFFPPLGIGFILTIFSFFLTIYGQSLGTQKLQEMFLKVGIKNLIHGLEPGVIFQDLPGMTLYAKKISSKNASLRTLEQIWFYDARNESDPALITAQTGEFSEQNSNGLYLELKNGKMYRGLSQKFQNSIHLVEFENLEFFFEPTIPLQKDGMILSNAEQMPTKDLFEKIQNPKTKEKNKKKYQLALYKRLSMPWANLLFIFLAAPITVMVQARTRVFSIVVTIFLVCSYYILLRAGDGLGMNGFLSARFAPFLPNIVLFLAGLYLWVKCRARK